MRLKRKHSAMRFRARRRPGFGSCFPLISLSATDAVWTSSLHRIKFFIIRNAENGGKTHLFLTQPTTASSRRWQIWYCPAVSCLCYWPSQRMSRKMTDFDLVGRFFLYCTNRARHEVCWQAEDKQTTMYIRATQGHCVPLVLRLFQELGQTNAPCGISSYQR